VRGRARSRAVTLLAGLGLLVGVVPAAAQDPTDRPPYVPATDLLPPAAPGEPAPDAAPVCGDDGLVCIRHVERELAEWEARFGCDHRAVFATVYRMLTAEIRYVLEDDPGVFDDPAGIGFLSLAFYELYEGMHAAWAAGEPVPDAWRFALEAAAEGDWTGGHDMLLSISAHVQRDMPHAMVRTGLLLPDGRSRKPDHDLGNRILNDAYRPIVRAVAERYDPLMGDVESVPGVDDLGAQQLVAGWREGVWRNAESLAASAGSPTEDVSRELVEANAHAWAETMRTGEVPDYREVRDAHCAAVLAAEAPAGSGGAGEDGAVDDDRAAVPPAARAPDEPTPAPADDGDRGLPATGGGLGALGLVVAAAVAGRRRR
jgi:hypothetical protein